MLDKIVFRNLEGWHSMDRAAKQEVLDKARHQTFKAGKNGRFMWVFSAMATLFLLGFFWLYAALDPHSLLAVILLPGLAGGTVAYLGWLLARLMTLVSIKKEVARLLAEADKTKP